MLLDFSDTLKTNYQINLITCSVIFVLYKVNTYHLIKSKDVNVSVSVYIKSRS